MQEKLTEKLESFSNLLDSLNNGKRKKLVMNLRSISKLNRLKQMMKNISFLADKNHINDTQSLSLTSRDEIERRIKRIKNEKNESLEITKESMRSAMVTLNNINRINIAFGNSEIKEDAERKSVQIHIQAIFQNEARIFVLSKSGKEDATDVKYQTPSLVRKLIENNLTINGVKIAEVENEDILKNIFGMDKGVARFILLELFEVDGDVFYAFVQNRKSCFYIDFLQCSEVDPELIGQRHLILGELSLVIKNFKGKKQEYAKIVEFNYKFGCLLVKNLTRLLCHWINVKFDQKGVKIRFLDLSTEKNKREFLDSNQESDLISFDDNTVMLIFRRHKIGVTLDTHSEIEMRIFYKKLNDLMLAFSNKVNNYSITRLSNYQFVDQCNRVAFEFVASGNFIYQEGMIIPEVKKYLDDYLQIESLDKNLNYEALFGKCQSIKENLDILIQNEDLSCVDISLSNTLKCHLRLKIDPLGNYIGFLIILRVKHEKILSTIEAEKIKLEKMESVEIDRNCSLRKAVTKITEALTKKFDLKQEELLELISEKEKVVSEIEGKKEFMGTVLEDYLINYRLSSPKKSIRYFNMNTIGKGPASGIYARAGALSKHQRNIITEESETSLFRFNSERTDKIKSDIELLRRQIKEDGDQMDESSEEFEIFLYKKKLVEKLKDFNFDVTSFTKEPQKMKFRSIFAMFDTSGVIDYFEVDKTKFLDYLKKAEYYYERNKNPYHNFEHGITVLHCCYYFLNSTEKCSEYFKSEISRMALLFGSLMHDVDHTGKNNAFMTKAMTPMARRYNDQHVLENHHCATAFKYLMKKGTDFLAKMSRNDFILFRKYVIHGIIKTDMAEHTTMVNSIRFKLEKEEDFEPNEETNPSNFLDFFSLIMHTSDLYTPSKKHDISQKWAARINEEMLGQLEHERKLELPVTSFYVGLDNPQIQARSEGFFIEKIVYPLWSLLDKVLAGALEEQLAQMKKNREKWRKIQNAQDPETDSKRR